LRDGLISFLSGQLAPLAEEVTSTLGILEGARTTIVVNAYERDPKARNRCIKKWGLACVACGFDFLRHYGILGEGFIHVHHLVPLSTIGAEYELNPEQDLRPVCPNCHAMLHRQIPPLTIEQLSALLLERPA
jgi:5-methylcytosine-specific restriction protein A